MIGGVDSPDGNLEDSVEKEGDVLQGSCWTYVLLRSVGVSGLGSNDERRRVTLNKTSLTVIVGQQLREGSVGRSEGIRKSDGGLWDWCGGTSQQDGNDQSTRQLSQVNDDEASLIVSDSADGSGVGVISWSRSITNV